MGDHYEDEKGSDNPQPHDLCATCIGGIIFVQGKALEPWVGHRTAISRVTREAPSYARRKLILYHITSDIKVRVWGCIASAQGCEKDPGLCTQRAQGVTKIHVIGGSIVCPWATTRRSAQLLGWS